MEEILSSIKRIIAEEGETPPAAQRQRPGLSKRRAELQPEPESEPEPDEVLELTDAVEVEPFRPEIGESEAVAPEPVAPRLDPVPAPEPAPTLVSPHTEGASREALAQLSALIVKPDAPGNTLEGLVTAMLKPMLRDWLDANLPELVETLVAKEIARISGKG